MPSLLPGTTMISTCSTFQSCRLNVSDDLQRQGKCSSCIRLVNPYWYILVPAGPVVFLAVTKKCDVATQNLQVPPGMQKKKKERESFIYYDKVITVYDPDDIDFNRTC